MSVSRFRPEGAGGHSPLSGKLVEGQLQSQICSKLWSLKQRAETPRGERAETARTRNTAGCVLALAEN